MLLIQIQLYGTFDFGGLWNLDLDLQQTDRIAFKTEYGMKKIIDLIAFNVFFAYV